MVTASTAAAACKHEGDVTLTGSNRGFFHFLHFVTFKPARNERLPLNTPHGG
jgi:hypothetical protein